ncbi:MAG: ribosomal protein L13e [Candidatus Bathyarchaeota archaeon]|nr:ribosomal protein L13e [Candidatus Bathyarchaeota archaeon]MCX8177655.1 ribosomal protein L13e [Candidatus Bathyarchaeota archaeon]MDW8193910.1 ribosomal protein L13e [Nitrososphaerota archaeon]
MEPIRPMVIGKGGKKRAGRGFSIGELKKVNFDLKKALRMGIPVDARRRTVHEENVEALKSILKGVPPKETGQKPVEGKKTKSGKEQ